MASDPPSPGEKKKKQVTVAAQEKEKKGEGKDDEAQRPSLTHALTSHSKRPSQRGGPVDPAQLSQTSKQGGGFCCGLLSKRKAAPPKFEQTLVILRHSERLDRVDPTYKDSDMGKAWPFDCPITGPGFDLAKQVAEELVELHEKNRFAVIACSPYRRCMETASEVAKALNLKVIIDQEIGEVWDDHMPASPPSHRSPLGLTEMAKELGISTINPVQEDGSIKLFGKPPIYPETLEDAKRRFVIRIETYINQSTESETNYILVTHADAVAASLEIFERGYADISNMDFCARLIAKRTLKPKSLQKPGEVAAKGVYADQWAIEFKGVEAQVNKPTGSMEKYYENQHLEHVEEVKEVAAKRKERRTKTDGMFDQAMKDLIKKQELEELDEEDEDEDDAPSRVASQQSGNRM